ncbi:MAG: hypothetical protein GTO24_11685 [candidate division Zixibacteria bacterium]|nr:hypothetical protein [candidate division Zixibacteria bacterium]
MQGQTKQIPDWNYHLSRLIPIIAVYIFLALYRIDHQSLWLDEVLSLRAADPDRPFFDSQIWFRGQGPLYFALLHFWAKLVSSEVGIRSLSVLIGIVSVMLTYALGLRLFNRSVAWIGTTLLATSPFFVWYSQEVRYVGLMMAASLFAMYAFHRALSAHRPGWWVTYCCSLILAIAAFVSNIVLPVVQWLFLLRSPLRRQVWRKVLVCQIVVFVLFIWWANGGHYQRLGGYWKRLSRQITLSKEELSSIPRTKGLASGGSREFELLALPYSFFVFSTGYSVGPSVRELQVSRSINALWRYLPHLLVFGALFCGLFVSGLVACRRWPEAGTYLVLWFGIPIIGALVVSGLTDMAYNVRYVSMALPPFIFILSAGIVISRRRLIQIILLVSVLFVHGFSLANYYFNPRYAREDARSASRYLESATGSEDIILIVGNPRAIRYYYKGDLTIIRWGKTDVSDQSSINSRLQEMSQHYVHLWLVEIRQWEADPSGRVKATLDEAFDLVEQKSFPGVDIYSYHLAKNIFSRARDRGAIANLRLDADWGFEEIGPD